MSHPLPPALAMAVPLEIARLRAQGRPNDTDRDAATGFARRLVERGDVLLFGGSQKGQAAALFADLVHALAVLAFLPGGVTLCGEHWEAA